MSICTTHSTPFSLLAPFFFFLCPRPRPRVVLLRPKAPVVGFEGWNHGLDGSPSASADLFKKKKKCRGKKSHILESVGLTTDLASGNLFSGSRYVREQVHRNRSPRCSRTSNVHWQPSPTVEFCIVEKASYCMGRNPIKPLVVDMISLPAALKSTTKMEVSKMCHLHGPKELRRRPGVPPGLRLRELSHVHVEIQKVTRREDAE